MSAVIIPTNVPAELTVLSTETIDRIDELAHRSAVLAVNTYDDTKPADALLKTMRALVSAIEAQRLELTRPLDAAKKAAIDAERSGTTPLTKAIADLAVRIKSAIDAHNAMLEAQRKAAAAEQARLQAEENARADAERKRLQEEADANTPPGDEPAQVSVVAALPKAVAAPYVPAPVKSSAIRAQTTYHLEYIDRKKVPAFSVAGHELRTIDESALKAFLKGLPEGKREIAGAVRLIATSGIAAKG